MTHGRKSPFSSPLISYLFSILDTTLHVYITLHQVFIDSNQVHIMAISEVCSFFPNFMIFFCIFLICINYCSFVILQFQKCIILPRFSALYLHKYIILSKLDYSTAKTICKYKKLFCILNDNI